MSFQGPPEDAYGRVTNAERFRPLHDAAVKLVDDLDHEYRLERPDNPADALPEKWRVQWVVRLVPDDARCATIIIALTDFPGVVVKLGHSRIETFPSCGCDACDEQPEGEMRRLADVIQHVVRGRLRESLRDDKLSYALGPHQSGWSRVSAPRAHDLGGDFEHVWAPWPPRAGRR